MVVASLRGKGLSSACCAFQRDRDSGTDLHLLTPARLPSFTIAGLSHLDYLVIQKHQVWV